MNHCVPDFEMDDDYSIPTSSVPSRPRKSAIVEENVMELLWQNGQVVLHNQNQRSLKKHPHSKLDDADQSAPREIVSSNHHHHNQNQDHLFMQEDEMASWLHYPLNDANFDSDFCADLLYPSAPCVTSATVIPTTTTTTPVRPATLTESRPLNTAASASRPPIPPQRRTENFMHFSRHKPRAAEISERSNSKSIVVRESTVVDSSDTPAMEPESRAWEARRSAEGASGWNNGCETMNGGGAAATSSAGGGGARDLGTCEMTVTSSPGGSSASAEPAQEPPVEDRKRKGREADDECHSEVLQRDHEQQRSTISQRGDAEIG